MFVYDCFGVFNPALLDFLVLLLLSSLVLINYDCSPFPKSSPALCAASAARLSEGVGDRLLAGLGIRDKTTGIVLAMPCRNESSRESG